MNMDKVRDELAWTMAMDFCKDFGVSPDSNHYKYANKHAKRLVDSVLNHLLQSGVEEFDLKEISNEAAAYCRDMMKDGEVSGEDIVKLVLHVAKKQHSQSNILS